MKIILIAFQTIFLTAYIVIAAPIGNHPPIGEDEGVSIRQDLIGKWEKQGSTNSSMFAEFKEDGSYYLVSSFFGGRITCSGIWEIKNGYIRTKIRESNAGFIVKKWVSQEIILISVEELKTQVEGNDVYIWKRIKSNKPFLPSEAIVKAQALPKFTDDCAESIEDKKLLAYADNSLNIEWYIPNDWKPLNVDIGINKNQPTWISDDRTGMIGLAKENRILSKEQIQEEEKELGEVDKDFIAYDLKRSGRKWHIQATKLEQIYTLHMITYLDETTIRFTIISDDPSENDQLMKVITGTFMYLP